jgi:hypothetical protein
VEQAYFRLAADGTVTVSSSSLTDPRAVAGWTELLEDHLGAPAPPGVPAITYVTLPGGYAAVLRRRRHPAGDIAVHALLGLPRELTPVFALTSPGWACWRDTQPTEATLPRVNPAAVPVPDAGRALRAQALRQAELLAAALAWLLQAPHSPIGLVGCPDGDRMPLLWALLEIGRTQHARSIIDRPWTFSTHGDPAPTAPPADLTFLDATDDPRRATGRIVVDLDGEHSAGPQKVNEAFAMLYRFEYGVDPVEPLRPSAATAGTGPAQPRPQPPSQPQPSSQHAPTGPAPLPAPAGRYAELVHDLVDARTGAQVRSALDQLEFTVTGLDQRDGLRAELESAGFGLATIERHVPAGTRDRELDRLVRVAFGASAPGRQTSAARADARRLTMTAESDDVVRALARAAEGDDLAPALAQRWMRQHLPVKRDPAADLGLLGRFLHARGRPITLEQERLALLTVLLVALTVAYLIGVFTGIAAA